MNTTATAELAQRATPLRLNSEAPFDDLDQLTDRVRDARVVALGSAVRQSHELLTLTHKVMRFLIEQYGFRSLALEGDYLASFYLDSYVRTGKGDPQAILAAARSFLRFAEILDAIRWIRAHNERNPDDQVRVVHLADLPREAMRLASGEDLEQASADAIIAWYERTGDRIVYWGGLAHTANCLVTGKNAGSYLRARFGSQYVSIALTFHHGSLASRVDVPPVDYIEAVLGEVALDTFLLDIQGRWPESLRKILDLPMKTRLIGPGTHELLAPSVATWLDFLIFSRRITPARAL